MFFHTFKPEALASGVRRLPIALKRLLEMVHIAEIEPTVQLVALAKRQDDARTACDRYISCREVT